MKLNVNFITLFFITLALCFAICKAHDSPSDEEPQSEPPPTESTEDQATGAPESEDPASADPASADQASEEPLVDPTSEEAMTEPSVDPVRDDPAMKDPEELYGDLTSANTESADPPSEDTESADPPSEDPASEGPASEDTSLADAPTAESPFSNTVEEGFFGGSGGGQLRKAFSSFFAEIRMGSLRGSKTITMLNQFNRQDRDSVKEICSRTDYPDDCLSTVVPFLGNKFDLMSVLEAAIKACSFQTNFTISIVDKHMKSSSDMATALANCKEQYTTALQSLQQALNALTSHDLANVTVMLSSVMADVSTCESGFEDLKLARGRSEGMVSITVSNCLSIAALIPS
ncbi:cell wall protein RBR3-like [Vigna umbellata]|uniref:cell wall protein RBR3-like n=1 Tax=Vigna umbellata TaxID=87088 RepID=UPI001F5E6614|nr:cell wall protein RBR3-like [Vigna umbellata]